MQTLEGTGVPVLEPTEAAAFADLFTAVVDAIGRALVGKPDAIRLSLICLLSEGHLLLEDVPGTGKTTLAKALAATIHGTTSRIQFTPDLLPSDVTGVTIYDQRSGAFEFHPGPIFASIVLADEINRASPKTQSALLEVMEESAVTVDGVTRPVGAPFMVIATQNPIEQAGTYRLPEAQLDRFLMQDRHRPPGHRRGAGHPRLRSAPGPAGRRSNRCSARPRSASSSTRRPGCTSTRRSCGTSPRSWRPPGPRPGSALGVSQRGAIALLRTGKTLAASRGRHFVLPDDIKALAEPVLAHRISIAAGGRVQRADGRRGGGGGAARGAAAAERDLMAAERRPAAIRPAAGAGSPASARRGSAADAGAVGTGRRSQRPRISRRRPGAAVTTRGRVTVVVAVRGGGARRGRPAGGNGSASPRRSAVLLVAAVLMALGRSSVRGGPRPAPHQVRGRRAGRRDGAVRNTSTRRMLPLRMELEVGRLSRSPFRCRRCAAARRIRSASRCRPTGGP